LGKEERMKTTAIMLGRTAAERLTGGRPSMLRAVAAATLTGGATATITYRLLRSHEEDEDS
jgi:hypothetical protein